MRWGLTLFVILSASGRVEPTVARPHSPGNKALARELADVKVDRVYIGSCTGGKTTDFLAAARVLKGREVKVPAMRSPFTSPSKVV